MSGVGRTARRPASSGPPAGNNSCRNRHCCRTCYGAIVSLFTIADHPLIRSEVTRLWLRAGDRYVFVCYSMVVMGFVMTFKWDSLFPDRRDYLILTPLPISLQEFFAAKVISLCGFLLLFVIA